MVAAHHRESRRARKPIDRIGALVNMSAMGGASFGFDLDPAEPLLAEAHDGRRADIGA